PWASVMAVAPMAYPSRPSTYARLRPKRSPTLLPIRMNAADTSASSAIADWTLLTVVSRSRTTAEIDTFISDVSTTSTNIAIASRRPSLAGAGSGTSFATFASSRFAAPRAMALAEPAEDGPWGAPSHEPHANAGRVAAQRHRAFYRATKTAT